MSETKVMSLEEIVEKYAIEEVVIKNIEVGEGQVLKMMKAAGLEIGGSCMTRLGQGTVLGFEANETGVLVVTLIDGEEEPRTFMASAVTPLEGGEKELTDEIEKLMEDQAPWVDPERSSISEAIFAGGMTIRNIEDELTESERFEAYENERQAQREEWLKEWKENAKAVSKSEAAQQILALANKELQGGGAPQAPAAETRRPQSNKNQNGGNVEMQTQVKDQPIKGVAGGKTQRRSEVKANRPSTRGTVGQATTLSSSAPVQGNRRSAGRAVAASANTPVIALRQDAPIANRNNSKWYEDARYTNVMPGADFEEERKNPELGITGAKFYDAKAYAESRGYEARDTDLAILVLEFGPALSFQFNMKLSTNPEAKQPWYISNVSFVRNRNNNGGRWAYVVGRRKDDAILIEKEGNWVMANHHDLANANKEDLWEIQGVGWVNETIYGMYMGEEVIAQVMRWASYGWDAMTQSDEEASE